MTGQNTIKYSWDKRSTVIFIALTRTDCYTTPEYLIKYTDSAIPLQRIINTAGAQATH